MVVCAIGADSSTVSIPLAPRILTSCVPPTPIVKLTGCATRIGAAVGDATGVGDASGLSVCAAACMLRTKHAAATSSAAASLRAPVAEDVCLNDFLHDSIGA